MVIDKVNLVKSHVGRALDAGPAKEDARGDRGCWSVIIQQQLADTPALVTEGLRFSHSKYYSPASKFGAPRFYPRGPMYETCCVSTLYFCSFIVLFAAKNTSG